MLNRCWRLTAVATLAGCCTRASATAAAANQTACEPIRRVGILGAGAIGAIYANHFAKVPDAFQTVLLATGERAERLRSTPWVINGKVLQGVAVTDPSAPGAEVTPVDLLLVAVKHQHLLDAVKDAAPLVAPNRTLILSVMNGLDSEDVLIERFGERSVLHCMALAMDSTRKGREVQYANAGKLVFGATASGIAVAADADERVARVAEALSAVGLEYATPDDIVHEMWFKFMVNVGVNQASAIMQWTYAEMRDPNHPQGRRLMEALQREVIAVAAPAGVSLGPADVERWQRVFEGLGGAQKTSMLQDVEAGRPTEVEAFAGKVMRLGERFGVETPTNRAVYHLLRVMGAETRT